MGVIQRTERLKALDKGLNQKTIAASVFTEWIYYIWARLVLLKRVKWVCDGGRLTWAVLDVVGVQADVVSGVEQFDQRAAGDAAEVRVCPLTAGEEQQDDQRPDKHAEDVHELHLCASVLMTAGRHANEVRHFSASRLVSTNHRMTSPKTRK